MYTSALWKHSHYTFIKTSDFAKFFSLNIRQHTDTNLLAMLSMCQFYSSRIGWLYPRYLVEDLVGIVYPSAVYKCNMSNSIFIPYKIVRMMYPIYVIGLAITILLLITN